MKYDLQWLRDTYDKGDKLKFLYFWGHQVNSNETIGASCFSQWWEAPFLEGGLTFSTAEHWMMYQKALLFKDNEIAGNILQAKSPAKAKELGRKVRGFSPSVWDSEKYEIVKNGNVLKFSQNPELKTFLMNTQKRVLVEASPVDSIWGIGLSVQNEKIHNPFSWQGQNLLGFALMEVRDQLNKI